MKTSALAEVFLLALSPDKSKKVADYGKRKI